MTPWTQRFVPPPLATDEVHLWRADLAGDDADLAHDQGVLSSDERARADRFASAGHARRYVRARSLLRGLLGAYLGKPPATLVLAYGPHGKPQLSSDGQLRFNLSHCGELAVIALACVEVGVDIERIRDEVDVSTLAGRTLGQFERTRLLALPADRRQRAFFDEWTRQEARLKAVGTGWSVARSSDDRLTVRSFDCEEGFLGAVAFTGAPRNLRFFYA